MNVLPPRKYATDEERKLAEALDACAGQMLKVTDAACRLRTAPGEARRHRSLMRTALQRAANNGMDALAHSLNGKTGEQDEQST